MQILCRHFNLEELNAALLRLNRAITDDKASLETRVTQIIDNSKTLIKENAFDDTAIQSELTRLSNLINALQSEVDNDKINISTKRVFHFSLSSVTAFESSSVTALANAAGSGSGLPSSSNA